MTLQDVAIQREEKDARIGPAKVRDLYERGVKDIQNVTRRYWENLAFRQGEQWIYWSKAHNRLVETERDPARVRVTVNRLEATIRRLLAKSLKRPLIFEVPPTGADDATIQGARIAESVLADLKREQVWEGIREELTIAALDGGTGLLCLDWNPAGGIELEHDETAGTIGTGEVQVTCLSITEAVTEPGTKDIEKARWWIKAEALPAAEVKEAYNLKEKPKGDASAALSPAQQKVLAMERASKPDDLTLVLTYYERPCKEHPDGQVCVVVGENIVDGPHPWPFPFKDRLNVVCARETRVLHRWTGDTIVSHAVPIQTAYNAVWSSFVEHVKLCGNARVLWPMGAGDAVDSLSDLPSEVVEYMAQIGGAKPEWWAPSPVSQAFLEQIPMLERVMDDTLGTPDVVRGEAPRNIESGSGLAILSEQAETPIARLATSVADAFARLAGMVLELYEANVTETRTARVDFPHQISQSVPWSGKDIQGQTKVIVPSDAILPVSEAEIWTKGVNLYDRGGFGDPGSPQAREALARYVSSRGGEESFIEATDPDVARAQRENYTMSLGEPALPELWDDHGKHIATLNTFRKSAAFERLGPEVKMIFEEHAMAHQLMAAQQAAEATNRQLQDQGTGELAAIPTANQDMGNSPTGSAPGAPVPPPPTQTGMGGAESEMVPA